MKEGALRRFLRLRRGDSFTNETWQKDLQQLMNRGLFASITTSLATTSDGLCLLVTVRTNWWLLPYIGAQTGAVPILMLGANHANVLGELVEGGGYYMRRGSYNLGRAWLVMPNFVTHGSLIDLEMVMTGELMLDYPSPPGIADGIEQTYADARRYRWTVPARGLEVLRRGGFADFGYQVIPDWLLISGRYVLLFETSYELPNVREVFNAQNHGETTPPLRRSTPEHARLSALSLTALSGHIDLLDNYRYRGHETRLVLTIAAAELGSQRNFAWVFASSRLHKSPGRL